MTIREAYRILASHQEWRLGKAAVGPIASRLTEAIDVVLKYVEAGISE